MTLSWPDGLSIIILTLLYLRVSEVKGKKFISDETARELADTILKIQKVIAIGESEGMPIEELDVARKKLKELEALQAAVAFAFYIGKNSFIVPLGFGVASMVAGITSLPGLILGFCLSSPRMLLHFITHKTKIGVVTMLILIGLLFKYFF